MTMNPGCHGASLRRVNAAPRSQESHVQWRLLEAKLMADLTTSKRNAEPKSDFGLPEERKYPMPDAAHARNAKARASQMEHQGKLSSADKKKIDAKADKILGKK